MFPQIFGKYVLERELASGGMARVFLATLRGAGGFEKRLVVKQIRPELASDQSFIQRFVAEAKTTVELSHANIVPVYELGAEQGVYYIAMELCAGVSLAELLRAGPVTPAEGAYIGVEICRALDYAHRKAGIVHRDVTPRNVMIDAEGMVKLIDFGIASPASAAGSGALFGSPGHMAPEQLRAGAVTPAADVFAVAVLLIETWSGKAPFRRESFAASADALREPPPPLAETDPRLAALQPLIASALALGPEDRPQTTEELARPLREFLRQDDLGDLARRLGERVGALLQRAAAAPVSAGDAPSSELSADALAARSSELPTRTFAARPALLAWTAKIESVPPASSGPTAGGPAALESGMTAPSDMSGERGRGSERRGRPLVAALALGGALLLGLGGRAWLREPSRQVGTEHLAAPSAAAPPASAASVPPVLTASPAPLSEGSLAASAGKSSAPAASPLQMAAPGMPGSAPRAPKHAAPRPSASPAQPAAAPRGLGPALSARLQLTADPPAWVELDGTRVGRTPLSALPVSAGRHEIRFENPLLGERLEAQISVALGGSARVHADFSSASPQVYVR